MVGEEAIIGWATGLPGFATVAIGAAAIYYMYKAAKAYGGKIGSAFVKIAIGVVLLIICTAATGFLLALSEGSFETTILISATAAFVPLVGFLFILLGAREFARSIEA